MGLSIFNILELCALSAALMSILGVIMLTVASRKARREFRAKGFLRPPTGKAWFRFLLWKQYQYFDSPSTRFCFEISYFCMIGFSIVVMAAVALLGSAFLLNGMSGFSVNFTAGGPIVSLPK